MRSDTMQKYKALIQWMKDNPEKTMREALTKYGMGSQTYYKCKNIVDGETPAEKRKYSKRVPTVMTLPVEQTEAQTTMVILKGNATTISEILARL